MLTNCMSRNMLSGYLQNYGICFVIFSYVFFFCRIKNEKQQRVLNCRVNRCSKKKLCLSSLNKRKNKIRVNDYKCRLYDSNNQQVDSQEFV